MISRCLWALRILSSFSSEPLIFKMDVSRKSSKTKSTKAFLSKKIKIEIPMAEKEQTKCPQIKDTQRFNLISFFFFSVGSLCDDDRWDELKRRLTAPVSRRASRIKERTSDLPYTVHLLRSLPASQDQSEKEDAEGKWH